MLVLVQCRKLAIIFQDGDKKANNEISFTTNNFLSSPARSSPAPARLFPLPPRYLHQNKQFIEFLLLNGNSDPSYKRIFLSFRDPLNPEFS